jgi:DNA invertase Pin-like site-specific DNA recombinase
MKTGYARVSTQDQNLERQIDQLQKSGCERIFEETISGTKKERPQLDRLLDQLRTGDIIVVTELTRLSRSIRDLFALVDVIHQKGANLKSISEPWLDTTTPQGKLLFAIFAGVSQFERDLISERTRDGLSSAKARGRHGGRPPKPEKDIELAIKMHEDKKYSISEITKATGIGKTSLYRYLNKRNHNITNQLINA